MLWVRLVGLICSPPSTLNRDAKLGVWVKRILEKLGKKRVRVASGAVVDRKV